ncbi:MAG TPA: ATP-dependent RNA helicase HrpA [Marinobacterium sp.]|nr:ATP-dependent RNA helicase HrpA [Marinobacterium sp.]
MSLKPLYSQLDHCRICDRFPLRQALGRLAADDVEARAKVEERIAASIERVKSFETLNQQPINYPDLPVSEHRDTILAALSNHQVVVVAGETGSGKTTQLPKLCLELGLGTKGLIGHTQPRRLAARTVANRIAEELHTPLGGRVGYQVRFHDQVSDATQVKLMTDGILLAETQNDRYLEKYEAIIIDEAHERSLNIDFLLGYIKRILPKRPDLKLIITSATIDLQRFSEHFDNAPVIEVSGRTFPVEMLYRPLLDQQDEDERAIDLQQGILSAVDELIEIDTAKEGAGPGDILIFLPGEREIRETAETLRKAQLHSTEIMPLYARLSLAEQNRVFSGQRGSARRIVLSTNVAETSVTVPGIRYVIDPGLVRMSRYSYRAKIQRLPIEPVSQASANQRAGRCGRVAPGTCIRLYSQEDFNARPEFTDAEIRRTNLAAVILQMLQLRLGDIHKFPFIDAPDKRFINDGYKLLEELQAVDSKRNITGLGKQLARLPVDPRVARMLVEGHRQRSLRELIILASALSIQDPRERPAEKRQAADQQHKLFEDEHSDFITLLNIWNAYEEKRLEETQSQLRKWCQKHFLSFMRMREWRDLHRQLHISCRQIELKEQESEASYESIHRALLSGLLGNLGFKQDRNEYLGARNRRFKIFPGSGQFKKNPKWLVAAELLETSALYAHTVAKIEPEWIEPLAKHLVKRSYLEPHWEMKRAQVVAQEQVRLYGLTIVAARKVHYGAIDKPLSHEIFIRSALVEGEYRTNAPFFKHNQALLESVEALEDKSRRRDLVVDEETLYQFYAQRMEEQGGNEVVNGIGFEAWRKQAERTNPKLLFFTEADVMQRPADHISAEQYPDQVQLEGIELELEYAFEPGKVHDGISIDCPLPLLPRLDVEKLEWLVPGMLADKLEAILRGLPKQERKHFVPIPNYVKELCDKLSFGEGDLFEAISLQLLRLSGRRISSQMLREVKLDALYKTNIRVVDASGKLLGQGRDWEALQHQFGGAAQEALDRAPKQHWGETGLTDWSFGNLDEQVVVRHAGGIEVEAYPALVDAGDSVELKLEMNRLDAQRASLRGVARLMLISMQAQVTQVRHRLPKLAQAVLYTNKVFNERLLQDQILISAVLQLIDQADLPRSHQAFISLREKVRAELYDTACSRVTFVTELHAAYHRINKQLSGKVNLQTVPVLNDIRSQLGALVHPNYLSDTPPEWLAQLPRYLQGIEVRLEKYQRNLRQQVLWSEELAQWSQRLVAAKAKAETRGAVSVEIMDLRWWIEEYRISLFAQELGTRFKISEKRLKQRFTEVSE